MMNKLFEEQMQNETLKRRDGMMNKVRTPAPFGFFDLCRCRRNLSYRRSGLSDTQKEGSP